MSERKFSPVDIIASNYETVGKDPVPMLDEIQGLVKDKKAAILHENNSVLLLLSLDKESLFLHLFTMDKPMRLAASLKHFIELIRKTRYKKVYGRADNEHIVGLLSRLGVTIEEPDRQEFNWMARI